MSSARTVQFYGMSDVLEAAKNRGCICWAIFCGVGRERQFMFKCDPIDREGNAQTIDSSLAYLEKILEALEHSKAIYTIQFYEDVPNDTKIKSDTPCDGSFNFITVEREEHDNRVPDYYSRTQSSKVIQLLEKMDARITGLEESQEVEEEPKKDLADVALGWMENPEKLIQVIGFVRSVFGGAVAAPGAMAQRVGALQPGASAATHEQQQQPTEQDLEALRQALDILGRNDPKIIQHLQKLAHISETNKATFDLLVNSLEKM